MNFEKDVPEWTAEGTEPPASLKSGGFTAGYKPPAAFFNWFWSGVSACLTEIRTKLSTHKHAASDVESGVFSVQRGGTGKGSVTAGNYLVGNGTGVMTEKTPAQVLADIGAASADAVDPVVTTTGTSTAYVATVPGIKALTAGVSFIMVPHVTSSTTTPTLNVNGLGAKGMRLQLSFNTTATTTPNLTTFFTANKPIRMMYDGQYWKPDIHRTSADDLYGAVPIASGGTGAATAAGALDNLGITAALAKKAVKSVAVTVTATAAGWTDAGPSGPYTQTVNVTGVTASNNIIVGLASSATAQQRAAARDAAMSATAQGAGTITITCDGSSAPTVDLPVAVIILG